jgi:hypothetical protein
LRAPRDEPRAEPRRSLRLREHHSLSAAPGLPFAIEIGPDSKIGPRGRFLAVNHSLRRGKLGGGGMGVMCGVPVTPSKASPQEKQPYWFFNSAM